MTKSKIRRRIVLAVAIAGLLPNVASAQLGTGAVNRAAGAAGTTQAARAQAQAQQRVQAQVQQRVQAQAQQRVQAQIQSRAQARVANAASAAARAADSSARRANGAASLRADVNVRAEGNAQVGSNALRARTGASARAQTQLQLSAAEVAYYDDVLGRFNPFRQPSPQQPSGTAAAGGETRGNGNAATARGAAPGATIGIDSAADLNSRIGHAVRLRTSEISQIRDRALASGDAQLLLQADAMEEKLRGFANAQAKANAEALANASARSALNRQPGDGLEPKQNGPLFSSAFNASETAVANAAANSAVARVAAATAAAAAAEAQASGTPGTTTPATGAIEAAATGEGQLTSELGTQPAPAPAEPAPQGTSEAPTAPQ